jgi:uncharacterized protein (UPF0305 family)
VIVLKRKTDIKKELVNLVIDMGIDTLKEIKKDLQGDPEFTNRVKEIDFVIESMNKYKKGEISYEEIIKILSTITEQIKKEGDNNDNDNAKQ